MNTHPSTAFALADSPSALSAEDVAVAHLQGRCTSKVCYAPKTTSSGQRVYGHFSMDAEALGEAVGLALEPSLHRAEGENAGLLVLHRWLRDHEPVHEFDEATSVLPAEWSALEPMIEVLLTGHRARVFCTGCNRNVRSQDVRRAQRVDSAGGAERQLFCAEGHPLASLRLAPVDRTAEADLRAA